MSSIVFLKRMFAPHKNHQLAVPKAVSFWDLIWDVFIDGHKISEYMAAEHGKYTETVFNSEQTSALCAWNYPLKVFTGCLVLEASV